MKNALITLCLVVTSACGPMDDSDGGTGGGGGGIVFGGGNGGSGGGSASGGGSGGGGGLSPTLASDFAQLLASKQCPDFTDTNLLTTVFQTGIDRGCSRFVDQAYSCVRPSGANALVCVNTLGTNDIATNLPSCQESFTVAGRCSASVTSQRCYSISCSGSLDCPTGWSCNDKTGHCFDTSANCMGMPCQGSLDCPTGATCNSALSVCVKS